jgi:2-polyprenyl-6-hydroxyphenyl methylase / 3-demethylubiquinone-9 3-methyltransferase
MTNFANVDANEINKFDKVSQIWWDPKGQMGTLQTINPLRTKFIMERLTAPAPKILDVGCGGGILSEALAKAGAQVTGIDMSQSALDVAKHHAEGQGLKIDYRYENVEEYARQNAGTFDAVVCMEMLEHVPEPQKIVAASAQVLRPGGQVFFSTINRTLMSLVAVILIGENVLRLLPRGTHTYSKLIRPSELKAWSKDSGLDFVRLSSLLYNPLNGKFKVAADKEDMNYMVHFTKAKS